MSPGLWPKGVRVLLEKQLQRLPEQSALRDVGLLGEHFQLLRGFDRNVQAQLSAAPCALFCHRGVFPIRLDVSRL